MTRGVENTSETLLNFITIALESRKHKGGGATWEGEGENALVQEACAFSAAGLAMTRSNKNTL